MDHIISLLSDYKYLILFPLAIVEGPILAVIAGLLCSTGVLKFVYVLPIIVLGDVIGDSLCYSLGRFAKISWLRKTARLFGIDDTKINRVRSFFYANPARTISLSKITLGIGVAGIAMAGRAKVPYPAFIRICLLTSSLQYIGYLSIGLLFGSAYIKINHYLNYIASLFLAAALAALLFLFVKSIIRKL